MNSIGSRLRAARELSGLTRLELAKLAELSHAYPALIESGERERIGAHVAANLARCLGVTVEWLLYGAGENPTGESVFAAVEVARELHATRGQAANDGEEPPA